MPIPYRLDWVIEQSTTARSEPVAVEFEALGEYGVDANEARVEWQAILEHKWYLGERLGRDVGIRVALVDYFENIKPVRDHVSRGPVRRSVRSVVVDAISEPVARLDHILGEFVDAVRGTRSISL